MTSISWVKEAGLPGDADHNPDGCVADTAPGAAFGRSSGGDREVFARVVTDHQQGVARLASRLLGWDPEIDDIVQDVFAKAWERRHQLKDKEKIRSWLASITVNTARNRLRRRKLWRTLIRAVGSTQGTNEHEKDSASETLERDETGQLVRDAVNALPQRDKEVLVLRYLEHMTAADIAESLGLQVNAVEVRLHRARQRLAERLPKELKP